MFAGQRILIDHSGSETDLSSDLNDFRAGVAIIPMLAASDYLYIGSTLPFNHRHFEVSTANDVTATVKVEIWWSGQWFEAVDVVDYTATSGKSLAKAGIIQWSPNRLRGWSREQDSEMVTGISKTGIYDRYWARFSWSANLKATTALAFVGHKFSCDNDLESYYPDTAQSALKTSFETGKTTWDEQHFAAAEMIVRDLITRQEIVSANQIVNWSDFTEASCHKVAEIIYIGLGRAFDENRKLAMLQYDQCMSKAHQGLDLNGDGRQDAVESVTINQGWLRR